VALNRNTRGAQKGEYSVVETLEAKRNQDIDRRIRIGCVTNMTIFSREFIDLARRCDMDVTMSVDGPRQIHDKNRFFSNGRGSYDRVVQTWHRYQDEGLRIAAIACTYTPDHMAAGLSLANLYHFLQERFENRYVRLTVVNGWFKEGDPEEERFADYIRDSTFNLFYEAGISKTDAYDPLVRDILCALFSPHFSMGWCGLGRTTLTISAYGSVLPCYTLIDCGAQWEMNSRLPKPGMPVTLSAKAAHLLDLADPEKAPECIRCAIRDSCRGCPGGIFRAFHRFTGASPEACAYKIGAVDGLLQGRLDASRSETLDPEKPVFHSVVGSAR
jgi:uncharacterized protein